MEAKKVFGIDLGTTYSCIAYMDEHGRPAVIQNSENALTTPSVVYFESESSIVVGEHAKNTAIVHPDLVVETVKRQMGNAGWICNKHGKDYRAQEVSSYILRKVVGDAETNIGEKIEDVVITCPAYFGIVEKEATREAGILAGLNVRFIIPEPVAAAIAYGTIKEGDKTILVYDLGGGTFDVTLLRSVGPKLDVVATDGNHELGGKDWDGDLVAYFAQKLSEEAGKSADDLLDDLELRQDLTTAAEQCKITLSSRTSHTVRIKSDLASVRVEITRDDFDRLTLHRLNRTIELTKQVVERGREKGVTIDAILLVGGSTFMPQVEARLKDEFSYPILRNDPNQIVAKGAAIFGFKQQIDAEMAHMVEQLGATPKQAAEKVSQDTGVPLKEVQRLGGTVISTATAKSYGLEVVNRADKDVVQNLIIVDDVLPRSVTKTFGTKQDQQQAASLRIMENHNRSDHDEVALDECEQRGAAELVFLRPLPANSPIEVNFMLGLDGILKVDARDLTTEQRVEAAFKSDALMSTEELEQARKRAMALQVS